MILTRPRHRKVLPGAIWLIAAMALLLGTLALAAAAASVHAQPATPTAEPTALPIQPASDATLGYPALTIIATDAGFVVPDGITAGRYYETHRNAGTFWSHFFTLRVPDDVTDEELAASMQTEADPAWLFEAEVVGNADQTLPGKENHAIVDLAAGRYILLDPIRGLVGTFTVAEATSTEAPAEPAADFDVVMKEMLFEGLDETVPAGQTIWKVTNSGSIWHEAVIIRVPAGTTEASMLAESEDNGPDEDFLNSLVQGSAVISPGNAAWMIVNLEPGTYAVICTFPSDDGRVHAMDGMLKVITVA